MFEAAQQVKQEYPNPYIGFHNTGIPASFIHALQRGYIDAACEELYTYYLGAGAAVSPAALRQPMGMYVIDSVWYDWLRGTDCDK